MLKHGLHNAQPGSGCPGIIYWVLCREYPTELICCALYEGSQRQSALPMKLQDPRLWDFLVLLTPYFMID